MRIHFTWIILLILKNTLANSKPLDYQDAQVKHITAIDSVNSQFDNAQNVPKDESSSDGEKIISVRITSSIAVDRGKSKTLVETQPYQNYEPYSPSPSTIDVSDTTTWMTTDFTDYTTMPTTTTEIEHSTETPSVIEGANMEFIKQLQAKKGIRGVNKYEPIASFQLDNNHNTNDKNESQPISPIPEDLDADGTEEDVPLARSVPLSYSSKHYFQDSTQSSQGSFKLTTVNFNVVHDRVKENLNGHSTFVDSNRASGNIQTLYNEPAKVYSQPARVYSEPAKFYSEPAKIYSEPAKIYSEPAKIYSEPAKVYSEPAKFYSQPASLHLNPDGSPDHTHWKQHTDTTHFTTVNTTPITIISSTTQTNNQKPPGDHLPEKNYEVDEKISVMSDGKSHGVQQSNTENCKQENCKVGYVVEGRQYRKYRVEERTSDGFIVGEYGVVSNEDGALRGVRYTADSEASPRLIQDALMKFLQLK